jgi:sugar lactone lactonase YvrE
VQGEAVVCTRSRAELGEGVRWDSRRDELLWVDILGGVVLRETVADDGTLTEVGRYLVGQPVGAVVPVAGRAGWLLARGTGVAYLAADGTVTPLVDVAPEGRMNDAACDPQGRFWVGTIGENARPGGAVLARLDRDGTVTRVLGGLSVSNGIDWSPDGSTCYLVDSGPRTVTAFSFDGENGLLSDPRVVLRLAPDEGAPDGLHVDAAGDLWVAVFDGWGVRHYSPDGRLLGQVRVPVPQTTCPAFGGARLDRLFVTTGTEGWTDAERAAMPLAGGVFTLPTSARGRPAAPFRPTGDWLPADPIS